MVAFSLQLDFTEEVIRHFLENNYGDLSFFSEWYGPILSVEQNTIVGNVNLAGNRDYNNNTINILGFTWCRQPWWKSLQDL